MTSFRDYVQLLEGHDALSQPHVVSADPPMKLPESITKLAEAFRKGREVSLGKEVHPKGGERDITLKSRKLYAVGSAVTNYLLERSTGNIDLATDAHPDEVEKICHGHNPPYPCVKSDRRKGTVKIRVGGNDYDVSTLRNGNANGEGKLPFTGDLKQDALRRNFTLDALYYEILGKKIIDPLGGLGHLRDGTVKFVTEPKEVLDRNPEAAFEYAKWVASIPNGHADDKTLEDIREWASKGKHEDARSGFLCQLSDSYLDTQKYLETCQRAGILSAAFGDLNTSADAGQGDVPKTKPLLLASILKTNAPGAVARKLKEIGYTPREVNDTVFLLNLLKFKEEPWMEREFRRRLISTSLTRKQILDWSKANNLNAKAVQAMMDREMTD